MTFLHRFATASVTLITAAVFAACGSAATAPATDASLVGNYQLTTINGQSLPATLNDNGTIFTFTSGTLAMADTSYQFTVCLLSPGTLSLCGQGTQFLRGEGQWFLDRGTLVLLDNESSGPIDATASGNVVTIPYGSGTVLSLAFTKQ